jgi:corrinoid protein of di/trimethylamine methyltransferase
MSSGGTLENLKKAITKYDTNEAAIWARKAMEEKLDPVESVNAVIEVIKEVGDAFGRGELWLPDLFGAAGAMQSAMPILESEITRRGMERNSLGTVVIGTVYGDIHDIGKNLVSTMLTADGFSVHDLGVNITAEEFVEAVKRYKPNILAMSALLTVSAPEQRKVTETLKKKGLRDKVKIMVGGSAITEEFAEEVGADGYEATAPRAPKLARRLIGLNKEDGKC